MRLSSFRANPLLRPLGEGGGLRLADGRYIMSSHRSVGVIVGDFGLGKPGDIREVRDAQAYDSWITQNRQVRSALTA